MSENDQTITVEGEKATFTPSGDLTALTVPVLRDHVKQLVADGIRTLSVDLHNVKVLDSSGIGLLVAAHNSLTRLGGQLQVVNASENLIQLLRAFRLDKHFNMGGK